MTVINKPQAAQSFSSMIAAMPPVNTNIVELARLAERIEKTLLHPADYDDDPLRFENFCRYLDSIKDHITNLAANRQWLCSARSLIQILVAARRSVAATMPDEYAFQILSWRAMTLTAAIAGIDIKEELASIGGNVTAA